MLELETLLDIVLTEAIEQCPEQDRGKATGAQEKKPIYYKLRLVRGEDGKLNWEED